MCFLVSFRSLCLACLPCLVSKLSTVKNLRANVWKYQATDGHGQNLVFAKIWFVDGFYRLNKCDVVCFSKYRLNFEKKSRKSV